MAVKTNCDPRPGSTQAAKPAKREKDLSPGDVEDESTSATAPVEEGRASDDYDLRAAKSKPVRKPVPCKPEVETGLTELSTGTTGIEKVASTKLQFFAGDALKAAGGRGGMHLTVDELKAIAHRMHVSVRGSRTKAELAELLAQSQPEGETGMTAVNTGMTEVEKVAWTKVQFFAGDVQKAADGRGGMYLTMDELKVIAHRMRVSVIGSRTKAKLAECLAKTKPGVKTSMTQVNDWTTEVEKDAWAKLQYHDFNALAAADGRGGMHLTMDELKVIAHRMRVSVVGSRTKASLAKRLARSDLQAVAS